MDYNEIDNDDFWISVEQVLDEQEFELISMYFKEDYNQQELAEHFKISQQAINKRMEKILKKLRIRL